jgi:peroxiredoxin (alkyl hydroperoxide reductase subunit C)
MVADMTREITSAYGVLSEPGNSYYPVGVAMRATFVIDQQGIVRHQVVNDEPLGRSVDDVIRIVDGLQFFESHGQVCPAGWNKGDAGMVTTPWGVASYLSEHADAL